MSRKKIEVFESDYDKLSMRAGSPEKIAYVVKNLLSLYDACASDLAKLKAWIKAVEDAS